VAASWNAAKKAKMFGGIWVGRKSYRAACIGATLAPAGEQSPDKQVTG
jgi:hypothetical protein